MDDPHEDELGEILDRHAANLRSLALAERRYGDRAPNDYIGAAVRPAVDRYVDRASDGRFAWHDRFLTGDAGLQPGVIALETTRVQPNSRCF